MMASAQNLPFKMGQSITDSAMDRSDSALLSLSRKDDERQQAGLTAASRSGKIDGNGPRNNMNHAMNDLSDLTHLRAGPRQSESANRDHAAPREAEGADRRPVARANVLDGRWIGEPPATANEGQQRPAWQGQARPANTGLHN